MIYFATIHFHDDRWIALQQRMLARYVEAPYQVFAYVTGVSSEHHAKFDHVISEGDPPHARKLNKLAKAIIDSSTNDDDWMIFIDGDAFPIAPLVPVLDEHLSNYPLVAIQRLENLGEQHTHPCFTATTVGFWKQIKGEWGAGYQWTNALGHLDTDAGSNLYGKLKEAGIPWKALHRSNSVNLHPVFFGVYDDLIYHHGAGFRENECRQVFYEAGIYALSGRPINRALKKLMPKRYYKKLRKSWLHPEGRIRRRIIKKKIALDSEVFEKMMLDDHFPHTLIAQDQFNKPNIS